MSIIITDENDIQPTFPSTEYRKRVQENTEVDSIVIVLPASDGDLGENGTITYRIISGNVGGRCYKTHKGQAFCYLFVCLFVKLPVYLLASLLYLFNITFEK